VEKSGDWLRGVRGLEGLGDSTQLNNDTGTKPFLLRVSVSICIEHGIRNKKRLAARGRRACDADVRLRKEIAGVEWGSVSVSRPFDCESLLSGN